MATQHPGWRTWSTRRRLNWGTSHISLSARPQWKMTPALHEDWRAVRGHHRPRLWLRERVPPFAAGHSGQAEPEEFADCRGRDSTDGVDGGLPLKFQILDFRLQIG